MKYICIINLVLLSVVFVFGCVRMGVKYRFKLIRYIKKKQIVRFVVNVLIPFAVPLVISVLTLIPGEANQIGTTEWIITVSLLGVAVMNLAAQFAIWIIEKKEVDIRWENQAAKYAFNNLFEVYANKNSQLRSAYHNGLKQGMLTDADIPYNIFEQIRRITWEFCNTISKITGIPTKDLDDAFIYRYSYSGAGEKDIAWRWVTGKGSKFKTGLNDFAETTDSTFHYMSNNNVSIIFYNDKTDAVKKQRYLCSYRDHSHNCVGSIFAAKVAFSGNDNTLCEGIIMINSYGHKFMDNLPWQTEEELKELIQDSIFPCYSKLLTTELAMLYFRHQNEPREDHEKKETSDPNNLFKKKFHLHKKSYKCIIAANKKFWTKDS